MNISAPTGDLAESVSNPSCTVAGWYWYCDVHDTHGNADSEGEADALAGAHEAHKQLVDGEIDGCEVVVVEIGRQTA